MLKISNLMRQLFFALVCSLSAMSLGAQNYPYATLTQLNQRIDLASCNDSSVFHNDTVRTVGVVIYNGGLSEVPSSSVIGGYRPFIHITDTANDGEIAPYSSMEVQAIYEDASNNFNANQLATTLFPGDVVEIVGYINDFQNGLQLNTLNSSSITIINSTDAPDPDTLQLGTFNDPNRINNVQTGEPYEGAYVTFENVTVASVIPFSNGRVSFDIVDGQGNRMNVSDRFLAQKTAAHQVVNPNSPSQSGTGSFVPPVPGTFYNSISGIIRHSGNGCLGGTGRGYELNPFDSSHYNVGFAPPFISDVERDPLIPNDNQNVDITATITDFDGSVDSVAIAYTTDLSLPSSQWQVYKMPLAIGSTDEYEFEIPNQPDGTSVAYYIYAKDNEANVSYYPNTPLNQVDPNFEFYTVRADGRLSIYDVQFSLDPSGASPYEGETVTVRGFVTASQMPYDLGYVYIQDTAYTEWAGISLVGSPDLQTVFRNEYIQVTGEVQESFGFTQIAVTNVLKLAATDTVEAIAVDPSDSATTSNEQWEKYEGMLMKYINPQGGDLYITDEDAGFGDYAIATDPTYGSSRSSLALAGGNNASSLYVSLVSNDSGFVQFSSMFVPPLITSDTLTMTSMTGILSYGFGEYRLLPRANDDIEGLLDTATINRPNNVSLEEHFTAEAISIYPNPAREFFNVSREAEGAFSVMVFDLNGRVITEVNSQRGENLSVPVADLSAGVYLVKVMDSSQKLLGTHKMIIAH